MPRILILDDQKTNRSVLERLAASIDADIKVAVFGDASEALQWLETNEVDLVITDYSMPSMDGAEMTRRLRARYETADVPIIVITVHADRDFRLLSLEAGATDFLLSPVDPVEFSTRVRNLLALRRHQVATKQQVEHTKREVEKNKREAEESKRHAERLRIDLEASEKLRGELTRESREALAQVIDTLHTMVSASDRDGRLMFVNVAQASMNGKTPEDFVGRHVLDLFGPERAALSLKLDADIFETGTVLQGFEETVKTDDGKTLHLHTTKAPLRDGAGRITAVLSTSIDITERKRDEDRLLYLAHHDPLTSLPNRAFLSERLRESSGHGRRAEDGFALHFLDLDRFKSVNDALGHQVGDKLLQEVAKRLRATLREGDIVARLGGDEFAILQRDIENPAVAALLANRILEAFRRPFRISGRSLSTGASIGITLYPKDGTTADALLRNADLAMYRSKAGGRGGYSFFNAEMDAAAQQAMRLEGELRRALARREFDLVWQPQVSLRTGKICGAEALLRWKHAERGVILPSYFLSLAEETGLMAPITEWVLATACEQGVLWSKLRPEGLRISVNLSPSLFATRDVQRMVVDALELSGLPSNLLDLEITEQFLLSKLKDITGTLFALRDIGISFSIDDFGTGYSSLTYARSFPVQRLKVDQTYIARLGTDKADTAIVAAILHLAHGLDMEVVAEGVETAAQVDRLREMGCDEVQGFFVRQPVTADELSAMLGSDLIHLPPKK